LEQLEQQLNKYAEAEEMNKGLIKIDPRHAYGMFKSLPDIMEELARDIEGNNE